MEIMRAVLALLEREDGPVILEDFPKDAPGQGDPENMEGMVCPIPLRKPQLDETVLAQIVLHEATQLAPWHELFKSKTGRSTVGLCALPLDQAIALLGELLQSGTSNRVPAEELGFAFRYATEDLRNFYLEAAAMRPGGSASAAKRVDWFWGETSAGELLLKLHPVCLASRDEGVREIASSFLIPRAQKHRLK